MILETIKIAFSSLNANKLRTLLSMLGIIIGVGAVIAIVSIASGSQEQITAQISDLGSNLITINQGVSRGRGGQVSSAADNIFSLELAQAIKEYSPSVNKVVPSSQTSGLLIHGETNLNASLVGTSIDYQQINKYYPQQGKFFSEKDIEVKNNVMVVGADLIEDLFDGKSPLGKKIKFNYNNQKYLFTEIGRAHV